MKKKQIKKRIEREIQAEAAALEEKVEGNSSLDSIEPEENLYAAILEEAKASQERIEASQKEMEASCEVIEIPREKAGKKIFFHKKPLLAVAVIVVLGVAASVGVSGAKLFVPRVEDRGKDGNISVAINNDDAEYVELTEDEAYEKIEEELGILALRLKYKLEGMELGKVYIDKDMGEALLEFYYENHILTVYQNKQNNSSSTNVQSDGEIINKIKHFYFDKEVEIREIDKDSEGLFYQTQIEYGNAYYYLTTDMSLELFENILQGVFFKTV